MRWVLVQRPRHGRRGDHPLERVGVRLERVQRLVLDLDVERRETDEAQREAEHGNLGHEIAGPKLGRGERSVRAHRRGVVLDVVVQTVAHVARHGERGDDTRLGPVAQVSPTVWRRRIRDGSLVNRRFQTPSSVGAVQGAPEGDSPVLRRHERVARVLPVPRGAVRTLAASHEVPPRALGKIVRRARHDARGTLVDDAVQGRRERVHALADLPRAPGEVGVPHGREGVPVLPLGLIRGGHVGDAGVLPHVYPQRPFVPGGGSRPDLPGRPPDLPGPVPVPRLPRRRPRIRVLPGDVKVEGRVRLVRAERVGVRVAAASAAERLARLPAIHRRRRRELLLGGHQARVRAPFRLDHPPVRGGLVGADVSGRARPAV
mmetsp:Transcript_4169/g.18731  ORF Transcript_4169/g.18731 Transcript_4169/m.18731 type:complete len:374 (-) Transcript_4169:308-1429(-)